MAVILGTNSPTPDLLGGTPLDDQMYAGYGNDGMNGGGGNDRLYGGQGNDELLGGDGNDTLYGYEQSSDGNNIDGNDTMYGEVGNDVLYGQWGNDLLYGGSGSDSLYGGAGDDEYFIDNLDTVQENANAGTDTVNASFSYALAANFENLRLGGTAASGTGNSLNNLLTGNASANTLLGMDGDDSLVGGSGSDVLNGGTGNDRLAGEAGNDTLTGGPGTDVFYFSMALSSTNRDTITDFNPVDDTILLNRNVFTAMPWIPSPGQNGNAFFYAGTAAHDGNDRMIYNPTTGALYYDKDGTGASAQVLIATLTGAPTLTYMDFTAS